MDSFNFTLFQNVVKFLSAKDKLSLKLVNKKFNRRIDMKEDYEAWKFAKASAAFGFRNPYIVISGDDLFHRRIYFTRSDGFDVVTVTTYRVKNVDWANLKERSLYDIDNSSNWDLYDSMDLEKRSFFSRPGDAYVVKFDTRIVPGVRSTFSYTEVLLP